MYRRRAGDLSGKKILFCQSPPGRRFVRRQPCFKASLDRLAGLGAELEAFSGEGFDIEPIWRAVNHTAGGPGSRSSRPITGRS